MRRLLIAACAVLPLGCAPGKLVTGAKAGQAASIASSTAAIASAQPALLPSAQTTAPSATPTIDPHVVAALAVINAERAARGLPTLALDPVLSSTAARHTQTLVRDTGGDTTRVASFLHRDFAAGDTGGALAENQGAEPGPDADSAFKAIHDVMMAEGPPAPGASNDYSNLVDPRWSAIGIGLIADGRGNVWVTELFR